MDETNSGYSKHVWGLKGKKINESNYEYQTTVKDIHLNQIPNLVKNIDGSQRIRLGVKTILKAQEKEIAKSLLNEYDWQVVRKAEKGTEIDSAIVTYRDGIRTAYTTRKTEIDNCVDTAALVTLYDRKEDGTPNMTQYPKDPYNTTI